MVKKLMVLLILGMFMISMVSAFEFDNVERVQKELGDAGYYNVEIKNAFGLGEVLWSGELTKNTNNCGDGNCEAITNICLSERGSLIDDVKYETILEDGSRVEEDIRSYQFYIKTGSSQSEVDNYVMQCEDVYEPKNDSIYQSCNYVKNGTKMVNNPEWIEYNLGDEKDSGCYDVKHVGKKKPDRIVDWIIQSRGEWIESWAYWGAEETAIHPIDLGAGSSETKTKWGQTFNVTGGSDIQITGAGVLCGASPYVSVSLEGKDEGVMASSGAGTIAINCANDNITFNPPQNLTNGKAYAIWVALSSDTAYGQSGAGSLPGENKSITWMGQCDNSCLWTIRTAWYQVMNITYKNDLGTPVTLESPAQNFTSIPTDIEAVCLTNFSQGEKVINTTLWTNGTGTWHRNQTIEGIPTSEHGTFGVVEDSTYAGMTNARGIILTMNNTRNITAVTKMASCTAPKVDIRDENQFVLATASYSGSVATFSPEITLTRNKKYYIMNHNDGGSYTACYDDTITTPLFDNYGDMNISGTRGSPSNPVTEYTNKVFEIQNVTYRGLIRGGKVNFSSSDAGSLNTGGNTWYGQVFDSGEGGTLTDVSVQGYRSGAVTSITAHLRAVNQNTNETNDGTIDLANGTVNGTSWDGSMAWRGFPISYELDPNTRYAILISEDGGGAGNLEIEEMSTNPTYAIYNSTKTTDAGATFSSELYDIPFEINYAEFSTSYINQTFNFTIDGATEWGCSAVSSDNIEYFSDENRTVFLDADPPTFTITDPAPIIDYGELSTNQTLNITFTDINLESCWYNYNGTNISIAGCTSGISNTTSFQLESGDTDIIIYANDSVNNLNTTTYSWAYRVLQTNESYDASTTEAYTSTFTTNVTWNSSLYTDINAYLNYDGVRQSIAIRTLNGDTAYFTFNHTAPSVSASTNKTFLWEYLIEGIYYNGTADNQTVLNSAVDDCSGFSNVLFNLSLRDEEDNLIKNGTTNATSIEVELDVYSGSVQIIDYANTFSLINPATICSENNLNESGYNFDLIVDFSSTDRVNEFWFIDNGEFNTTNLPINISLMDLKTADSTSFLFNYFNVDGLPVADAMAHVWRKYVGDGVYREVERSKADQNGDTIIHLVEEDVIYYFEVSQNGTLLYTSTDYTALCQEVPCTITLQAGGSSADFTTDWDLVDNGAYIVDYSADTREVNLTFTTTTSSTFNLTVYQYDSDGTYEALSSDTVTGLSGSASVIVPQSAGNVTFFTTVHQDGTFLDSSYVDFNEDVQDLFGITLSLFLALLIILTLGLMAVSEGVGTIVFVILGVAISGFMGLYTSIVGSGISVMLYLILAGGILIWKLTGGRK